jgi:hypothetical protein
MRNFFNELMKNAISLWVIYIFTDMGYKILRTGQTLTQIQSNALEFWMWFYGCGFFVVVFTWFRSVAPFLKDVLNSFVSLRTGRQEAPPLPTPQPLPPSYPIQPAPTVYPSQMPNISQINSMPAVGLTNQQGTL